MQKKTISKVIKNKIDEWIDTITDTQLKTTLKDSVIVSGGCIASMLLGEDVNDYDVYIKDRSVLMKLVKYYCEPHTDIEILDGTQKIKLQDEYQGSENAHYAIALRNLKDDQIKIFIRDNAGKRITLKPEEKFTNGEEVENPKKYLPVYFSPNAISLSDHLQIVIRFHGSVEEVHKTFDFIHATNYWTAHEGVVLNLPAMESLMTRQLKYQGSQYPLTSIIRTRKFIKRKWNIGSGELLKIMFQISQLNLSDPDTLEEQLIGVDVAYFGQLIDALRNKFNKDPQFDLTNEYLGELIEKIFDSEE